MEHDLDHNTLTAMLKHTLAHRLSILNTHHDGAVCLFNGFYEGLSGIQVNLYNQTLVIMDYRKLTDQTIGYLETLQNFYLAEIPRIKAVLRKTRYSNSRDEILGVLTYGEKLDDQVSEHGIWYALDLRINQDASFYIDNRNLRKWLLENSSNRTILNTFAYTGTLGIAAAAGGAKKVIQTDMNQRFLNLSRKSLQINQFHKEVFEILSMDYFKAVGQLKNGHTLFDIVILDPPYFSNTSAGKVDLVNQNIKLINKVRPLIAHEGTLISINNALFVSGEELMTQYNKLCSNAYIQLDQIIPVPEDVTGYPETITNFPPAEPAPFNHPTKITIFKILRKDEARAT